MPKLPVLSGATLVKALERPGFEQVRQVLRQAGVTSDKLIEALS